MFRLHMDIPLDLSEEEAVKTSNEIIDKIVLALTGKVIATKLQYRLGNDDDRTVRNYLVKDENGHVSTQKGRVDIV